MEKFIIEFKFVETMELSTSKIQTAIVAKWGNRRKQGYLLPYRFDDEEVAWKKADQLMPIFPLETADLIQRVKNDLNPQP